MQPLRDEAARPGERLQAQGRPRRHLEAYAPSEIKRVADSASSQLALLDKFAASKIQQITSRPQSVRRAPGSTGFHT
jgi:hypothetical protein